jgi:hypothetical protein
MRRRSNKRLEEFGKTEPYRAIRELFNVWLAEPSRMPKTTGVIAGSVFDTYAKTRPCVTEVESQVLGWMVSDFLKFRNGVLAGR